MLLVVAGMSTATQGGRFISLHMSHLSSRHDLVCLDSHRSQWKGMSSSEGDSTHFRTRQRQEG